MPSKAELFFKAARNAIGEKNSYEMSSYDRDVDQLVNSGMPKSRAYVAAAREYPAAVPLIEKHGVGGYDPIKGSKKAKKSSQSKDVIKSEGIEQSFHENLAWALDSVGRYHREGKEPDTCPNDAAYFLYYQGLNDPKDFMAKAASAAAKRKEDGAERKSADRSIDELDRMLKSL